MINTLQIKHFKSIKALELPCRRVNVLIGEPNTGKSNILEALGLLSFAYHGRGDNARDFVRFEETRDIFHGGDLGAEVEVVTDSIRLRMQYSGGFGGYVSELANPEREDRVITGGHGNLGREGQVSLLEDFKFYRYQKLPHYPRTDKEFLLPPSGANLMHLMLTNRRWYGEVNELFEPFDLHLRLLTEANKIEMWRLGDITAAPLPYGLGSDTLLRFVFNNIAIKSNKQSVLVFEEPEAHAFPPYVKQLAERIALDPNRNQYFIATHNPYLLEPLIEKCPAQELSVVGVTYEDHGTTARRLTKTEVVRLLEGDPFFQLDSVLRAKTSR